MRFGTWNVRSLYRAGSLTAAARELARYKLDFMGLQEVRWDKGGMVRAGYYNFFPWKRRQKSSIGNRFFCTPQNSISS
jgi:exonuclease III